jgi:fatty acid synthase subunit alpha
MQRVDERDSWIRLNYAICAGNPSRASKTFSDAAPCEVVAVVAIITELLLEIMDHNIEVFILPSSL